MNSNPPPLSKDPSWWQMLLIFAIIGGAFLLWAFGFDLLAEALKGGAVEAVMSWLSRFWFWLMLIVFAGSMLFGRITRV